MGVGALGVGLVGLGALFGLLSFTVLSGRDLASEQDSTAKPSDPQVDIKALRGELDGRIKALRLGGRDQEALDAIDQFDAFIRAQSNVSLYNRYRHRLWRVPALVALDRLDDARADAEADIAAIRTETDRALAAKAVLPAGQTLAPTEEKTITNWESGAVEWLLASYHIELGTTFHRMGLIDRAATECDRAVDCSTESNQRATAKKQPLPSIRLGLRQFQARVLGGQFDPDRFQQLVKALEVEFDPSNLTADDQPVYAQHLARNRGHLGASLVEQARLEPGRWEGEARRQLELALACPHLGEPDRIEPRLALATLELRSGKLDVAGELLDVVQTSLGGDDLLRRNVQYKTFLALRARLALAKAELDGKLEGLEVLRVELAAALDSATSQFARGGTRYGGHGLLNHRDTRGLLSELIRVELRLDREGRGVEQALGHLLSVDRASTLGRRIQAQPSDLTRIRSVLLGDQAGNALVFFLFGPDRSHAFFVDAHAVEHVALPFKDELERQMDRAAGELGQPPAPKEKLNARRPLPETAKLAQALFPAALKLRLERCERVTFIGREMLGAVPFEALPVFGDQALGLRLEITDAPTASIGAHLVERARAGKRPKKDAARVAWVGLPKAGKLSLGPQDAATTLASFTKESLQFALAMDATPAALRSAAATAHALVVFTHGWHDFERDDPATLLFQGNGSDEKVWIGARELQDFDTSPLVVVMACGADLELLRRGDAGGAGLAGAFLGGGTRAQCVVLSSYDLDSGAALRMTRLLNDALAGGRSPAGALRDARRAMFADPTFADPFHWGLVRVVGAGHEAIFTP